jgi:hypothetical protein
MAILELYINKTVGQPHSFIRVDGLQRSTPVGNFQSTSSDDMLARAREMLEGDESYEPRLRIYDIGRRIVQGGDGIRWVTLAQLQLWTLPGGVREPRPDEAVLGKAA